MTPISGRSRSQRAMHQLSGSLASLEIAEPVSLDQRRRVAASCQANLFDGVVPLYVDTMDNQVAATYTARPTRMYFIGRDGRVLYNPGIGPFGYSPDHLEPVIREYLEQG